MENKVINKATSDKISFISFIVPAFAEAYKMPVSTGFVNEFEFSENDFTKSICKIKRFDAYDEEWLDFVVANRDKNSKIPPHDYDIKKKY